MGMGLGSVLGSSTDSGDLRQVPSALPLFPLLPFALSGSLGQELSDTGWLYGTWCSDQVAAVTPRNPDSLPCVLRMPLGQGFPRQ